MRDKLYELEGKLLDTLSAGEDCDDVKYYINGKEVKLHFEDSINDNGFINIYFTEER